MFLDKIFKNRFFSKNHKDDLRIFYNYFSSESQAQKSKVIKFEPVIGLEVHAQIQTDSKLFSSASTEFLSRPNSQATFFDVSLPGTLPVLNRKCVQMAIKTALALNCQISTRSTFDRKHYFYGDMPNGYQITQQRNPIARNGYIEFIVYDDFYERYVKDFKPYLKRCRLKQIQIEQDSGKSLVDDELEVNLIDLNRAGVPLMEFVFEPDLRSSLEAISLVRELIAILKAIQVCSCRMEEGALRVDANVSVRPIGSNELGTRTEVKNLNSFRFIREASEYEIKRQSEILNQGGKIINETMGYDIKNKSTFVMRDKEIVQDYRFMPEPNLPPIILAEHNSNQHTLANVDEKMINIESIRMEMPELPQQSRNNLLSDEYGLTLREIYFLLEDQTVLKLFHSIYNLSQRKIGIECFKFIMHYLKPIFAEKIDPLSDMKIEPFDPNMSLENIKQFISEKNLAQLNDMLFNEEISEATTYDILKLYIQQDQREPRQIVEQFNWWLINDIDRIEQVCREVINQVPKIAKKYANNGVRKPKSMLTQKAFVLLNNQVNEKILWNVYDKLLRENNSNDSKSKVD